MKNDIVAVLRADHALLDLLAHELRACAAPAAAHQTFRHFSAALGGHLTAVKKVIYPALKSVGWKDVRSDLLVGHARLTRAFAELLTLKTDSAVFADGLSDLLEATARLLELEQHELLPVLERRLDPAQRLTIGLEAGAYVAPDAAPRPHAERLPASEWLEEARLLLGGVHAPPAAAVSGS